MDLTPGAVIAGRYQVEKKVGAGGMGEVWVGQQLGIGVRVAVKTLLPATATNTEVIARFRREAFLLAQIRSEHVARVIDFVTDDTFGLVLVMEFVEGEPLSRGLQEKTLTVEEAIELGVGIASALKDLHKANIIHRDLKPGNIIMAPLPDGRKRAVVVDFGVSRMMSDKSKDEDEELTGITRADMAVGTIEYMAPEQILNSRNVTPGSDIYAAGAMLFRAAAGRHIFDQAKSDGQLAQQKLTTDAPPLPLPRSDKAAEGLIRVVGKMIKRRPSERYKTADEVLADLVPVRDMARGAAAELESTTIDAAKGLTVPMPNASAASPSKAQVALVAQPAPAPAPAPAPQPASVVQPTPTGTPVTPPASVPAPTSSPTSADSSVSVSAPAPAPKPEARPRRGIPPVVTFGLVAAALAGGIFLGPRVMAPAAPAVAPVADRATSAPTATQAPTAAETAAPSATATAEPAPSATATAAASATAIATAGATVAPSATAATSGVLGVVPSFAPAVTGLPAASGAPAVGATVRPFVPGPMPKPAPPKPTAAPAATAPAAPAKPPPAEPSGI